MNKTLKLNLKMLVFALFLVVIDQISKYAAIIALKLHFCYFPKNL